MVCQKAYGEGELKVKDHSHVTKNYQRFAHQECNLYVSLSEKVPAVFHGIL